MISFHLSFLGITSVRYIAHPVRPGRRAKGAATSRFRGWTVKRNRKSVYIAMMGRKYAVNEKIEDKIKNEHVVQVFRQIYLVLMGLNGRRWQLQ